MLFRRVIKSKLVLCMILFFYLFVSTAPIFGFYSQFLIPDHQYETEFLKHFDSTEDVMGALIASGVEPQNYAFYASEIARWKKEIEATLPPNYTQRQLAEHIGIFLHDKVYDKYVLSATTLKEVFEDGYFNCLSATILMNIMLRAFGIEANAISLPMHVYTVAYLDGQWVEIENTIRDGLSISNDRMAQEQFNKITGIDYHDNKKKKVVIDWKGTVGLLYSNRAHFDAQKNLQQKAFQNMLKAQVLLDHVPTEHNNLRVGYLNYSYSIYMNKKGTLESYLKALSVLEEGIKRYPGDFLKNNYLKGVSLAIRKMIDQNADLYEIDKLLQSTEPYVSIDEMSQLNKYRYGIAALFYMEKGRDFRLAKKSILKLQEHYPKDPQTKQLIRKYLSLVVDQDLMNNQFVPQESTIAEIKEFPIVDTKDIVEYYYIGLINKNLETQNFKEASKLVTQVENLVGKSKNVLNVGFVVAINAAQYYLNIDNTDESIDYYKKALAYQRDSSVINNLGILYHRKIARLLEQNKIKLAKQVIQESKAIVPDHPALRDLYSRYS